MNKEEEAKQYLRNQIDSSIKIQDDHFDKRYYLYYNKQYLRSLKLSKITGQPVNKNNFKGGEILFWFNTEYKKFHYYSKIVTYLEENYSKDYTERKKILEEVFNEYDEYKGYKMW